MHVRVLCSKCLERGANDFNFLAAQMSILTSMRIETENVDSWVLHLKYVSEGVDHNCGDSFNPFFGDHVWDFGEREMGCRQRDSAVG